jgi:hypothetical protein
VSTRRILQMMAPPAPLELVFGRDEPDESDGGNAWFYRRPVLLLVLVEEVDDNDDKSTKIVGLDVDDIDEVNTYGDWPDESEFFMGLCAPSVDDATHERSARYAAKRRADKAAKAASPKLDV